MLLQLSWGGASISHADSLEAEPIVEPKDNVKEEVGNDIAKVEEIKEEVQSEVKEENIDNNNNSEFNTKSNIESKEIENKSQPEKQNESQSDIKENKTDAEKIQPDNKESKEIEKDKNLEKDEGINNDLEVSENASFRSVRSSSNEIDTDLYTPNCKYDEPMKIDDPKTYDYVKYMVDHYNPTNEGFKEKGLKEVAIIDSRIMDDTNKVIGQSVFMLKGKDFSNKIDEFIAGLKKGQKENKLNEEYIEDLKHKIFVPDDDDNSASNALSSSYSVHLNKYLDILSGAYASTLEGEGNGHSTIDKEGNLINSDYTFENFKKSYESFYIERDSANINFAISDSFKNRPIVRGNYLFLTKEQYLQDKDKIIDYLKNKIAFGNFTSRHTHISSSKAFNDDNSEVLPANIKSAFDEEELKKLNNAKSFNIIYDKQHINYQNSSHAKNDLSNADYLLNKDVLSDNSFTLRVDNGTAGYKSVDLPFNYYLSENDKPIYKADSKLKFKEKSDIVGSKYYISNTHNDTDVAVRDELINNIKITKDEFLSQIRNPCIAEIDEYLTAISNDNNNALNEAALAEIDVYAWNVSVNLIGENISTVENKVKSIITKYHKKYLDLITTKINEMPEQITATINKEGLTKLIHNAISHRYGGSNTDGSEQGYDYNTDKKKKEVDNIEAAEIVKRLSASSVKIDASKSIHLLANEVISTYMDRASIYAQVEIKR